MKKNKFMELAISLAKKGFGFTAPNPCVGAVITRGDEVIGMGYHKRYGGPHAEVEAIEDAISKGKDLADSTLWVTLEPCNHHGKTPPCTEAILKHKIKRVNIGVLDPNPNVRGGGAEYLRSKGVEVTVGINGDECGRLIQDFVVWNTLNRPYIYLKLAQTLDGKIATRSGDSRWISCEKSREFVHRLRSRVDGVLIGGNTFFKDNPRLTPRCRGENKKDPFAIVLTSKLPQPQDDYFLITSRPDRTIFITTQPSSPHVLTPLQQRGVTVFSIGGQERSFDLKDGLSWLFLEKNCYYILCEGGGMVAYSLLSKGLVDEVFLFIAPIVIGDDFARSSFSGSSIDSIKDGYSFEMLDITRMDRDILLHLVPDKKI